jgi:quercetin dioxygenase-like cupin family protein
MGVGSGGFLNANSLMRPETERMNTLTDTRSAARQFAPGTVFERPTMRSTLLELSDDAFRIEVEAGPDANGGPLHRHTNQSERFIVKEGALIVRKGLRARHRVGPGKEILVPAGMPHTFSVDGESAHFIAEFTPPLQVADYFLALMEIDDLGLHELAELARRYPDEHFYLPVIPPAVQRAFLRIVG